MSQTPLEIILCFPLSQIEDLYHFRFEVVEPALDDTLQQANAGICDYGFVDDNFLKMVVFLNDDSGLAVIAQVLHRLDLKPDVWRSEKGILMSRISL